jgi:hypothetical protein
MGGEARRGREEERGEEESGGEGRPPRDWETAAAGA